MHYSVMEKMRLLFIDFGVLYRSAFIDCGVLYRSVFYRLCCVLQKCPLRQVWLHLYCEKYMIYLYELHKQLYLPILYFSVNEFDFYQYCTCIVFILQCQKLQLKNLSQHYKNSTKPVVVVLVEHHHHLFECYLFLS